ncbi:MAG TPA: aminoglycoside phosphotransferase family protein [Acetobacteraceae bacterium]|nr:aminoglycoside phosphotransferase family protein [Acetobacteraceae bacterium]
MTRAGPRGMMAAVDRDQITADVAARLVAEQFPQWADLPVVPVGLNGWDNTTFRLGEELSVRLPSGGGYVPQIEKEHRWLPFLAGRLPLPIPEPIAIGRRNDEFPWPWSIYRWIDGEPASVGRIADVTEFAADLAKFLTALQAIDGSDGPPPGKHSSARGGPVARWEEGTRQAIDLLAADIDTKAVTEVWDAALASTWNRPLVWVHGDVVGSNLLVQNGALSAAIDFGCSAVGDPACDMVMAWTFFAGESAKLFRRGLRLDDATWARGRGWALWKALIVLSAERQEGADAQAAARRFGWRYSAYEIIDLLLDDHRQSI